jgi:hypothetical protein
LYNHYARSESGSRQPAAFTRQFNGIIHLFGFVQTFGVSCIQFELID